jgi:hypothetical protein
MHVFYREVRRYAIRRNSGSRPRSTSSVDVHRRRPEDRHDLYDVRHRHAARIGAVFRLRAAAARDRGSGNLGRDGTGRGGTGRRGPGRRGGGHHAGRDAGRSRPTFGDPAFGAGFGSGFASSSFSSSAYDATAASGSRFGAAAAGTVTDTVPGRFGAAPVPGVPEPTVPRRGNRPGVVAVVTALVVAAVAGVVWYVVQVGQGARTDIKAAGAMVHHGKRQATETQVQADVRSGASAEETYLTDHMSYTTSLAALQSEGLRVSPGDDLRVVAVHGTSGYCLAASAPGVPAAYYDNQTGGVSSTPCH